LNIDITTFTFHLDPLTSQSDQDEIVARIPKQGPSTEELIGVLKNCLISLPILV
jgi:hypothetical protein